MDNTSSPTTEHHQNPTTVFTNPKAIITPSKIKHVLVDFTVRLKNIGLDDPRRIAHSLKVAFAITLVSMVYYLKPLYKGMGDAGMWAIFTVVVVFEYTVGATLCKCINRGFATLLAGALGIGAESLASLFGPKVKPVVLGFLVFLLVAASTFSRFIPFIKRRYDYGVMIFILTFSLVSVSGYRVDKILELAHHRLSAILFGGVTCIIISMFVCPVWAGEDLHKLIVLNLEKLASLIEGFGSEFCKISDGEKSFRAAYKSVLNSKPIEESLVNFAWWEVGHGKYGFRHPWKQYLKIGGFARQCAYHIEALNGFLEAKLDVVPSELEKIVEEPYMKMSSEAGIALKELALSMKLMMYPSTSAIIHIDYCKKAVEELKATLQFSVEAKLDVLETMPVIAITSILVEIIKCVESIYEAIEELSKQANFKEITSDKNNNPSFLCRDRGGRAVTPIDEESIVIDVPNVAMDLSDNGTAQESNLNKSERIMN